MPRINWLRLFFVFAIMLMFTSDAFAGCRGGRLFGKFRSRQSCSNSAVSVGYGHAVGFASGSGCGCP